MPVTRIAIRQGRSREFKQALMDEIYEAMRETIHIKDGDRFMTITEHGASEFAYGSFLDIERTRRPGSSPDLLGTRQDRRRQAGDVQGDRPTTRRKPRSAAREHLDLRSSRPVRRTGHSGTATRSSTPDPLTLSPRGKTAAGSRDQRASRGRQRLEQRWDFHGSRGRWGEIPTEGS